VCALQSDEEKMIHEWFLNHGRLEGEKVRNSMKVFGISKKKFFNKVFGISKKILLIKFLEFQKKILLIFY
jgi:hypothetical protein